MTENKPPTPGTIRVQNRFKATQETRTRPSPVSRPAKPEQPRARNGRNAGNGRREPFLNPFTFVPAFSREAMTEAFADAVPQGADRLHEEN